MARDALGDPHQVQAIWNAMGLRGQLSCHRLGYRLAYPGPQERTIPAAILLAATLAAGGPARVALGHSGERPIAEVLHGDPVTWIGFTPDGSG